MMMPDEVCFMHQDGTKLISQTAPLASNIMKHPELARTFEAIAEGGHDGYYKGRIAQG
jgi:gamma-glutamyltranspeptidase